MCSQEDLRRIITKVYQHAKQCFGKDLGAIILYGSYARGTATEESDIDIMILVRQTAAQLATQRREWSRFGTQLDLEYGVLTSFKLQDVKTYEEWRDTLPFFINVDREGVHVSA